MATATHHVDDATGVCNDCGRKITSPKRTITSRQAKNALKEMEMLKMWAQMSEADLEDAAWGEGWYSQEILDRLDAIARNAEGLAARLRRTTKPKQGTTERAVRSLSQCVEV